MKKEQLISIYKHGLNIAKYEYDNMVKQSGCATDLEVALLSFPLPKNATLQKAYKCRFIIDMYNDFVRELEELE